MARPKSQWNPASDPPRVDGLYLAWAEVSSAWRRKRRTYVVVRYSTALRWWLGPNGQLCKVIFWSELPARPYVKKGGQSNACDARSSSNGSEDSSAENAE